MTTDIKVSELQDTIKILDRAGKELFKKLCETGEGNQELMNEIIYKEVKLARLIGLTESDFEEYITD